MLIATRNKRLAAILLLAVAASTRLSQNGFAQNVVTDSVEEVRTNRVKLTEHDVEQTLAFVPQLGTCAPTPAAEGVREDLRSHIVQLLTAWPYRPLHHTLGISGYECCYTHPDELFYALAISHPYLLTQESERLEQFLRDRLAESPPFGVQGFDPRVGTERESYSVPESLRVAERQSAHDTFGVYAFWAYCHYVADLEPARRSWNEVTSRMQPLLQNGFTLDVRTTSRQGEEAEQLNGNLAGMIGFVRLARGVGDREAARMGVLRCRELMQLRIDLECVNSQLVTPTHSASNSLHNFKLARFCRLTPEIGYLLAEHSDGLAVARLSRFRGARNAWYLAFGDRMIGGENYTNPLHFSQALFSGAAFVERLPGDQLCAYVDVPWCKADFYFLEKCVWALWSSAGRRSADAVSADAASEKPPLPRPNRKSLTTSTPVAGPARVQPNRQSLPTSTETWRLQ